MLGKKSLRLGPTLRSLAVNDSLSSSSTNSIPAFLWAIKTAPSVLGFYPDTATNGFIEAPPPIPLLISKSV